MTESPSTQACEIKPTWNAAVCKGDIGRMRCRWHWPWRLRLLRVPVAVVLRQLAQADRLAGRWCWR